MKNPYFKYGTIPEQRLYDNLVRESIEIYGLNCYYLPRKLITYDKLFGEDINSQFGESYIIDMYLESYQNFEGQGDLFTKFGVQINDQALFTVSRTKWEQIVSDSSNLISNKRPNEGDLIYYPLGKKLFQINFVEHEAPFWQLGDVQMYKLRCELFTYTQEKFDTSINELKEFERKYAFAIELQLDNIVGKFLENEIVLSTNLEATISRYDRDNKKLIIYSSNENPTVGGELEALTSGATATIISFKTIDEANKPEESDNLYFEEKTEEIWTFEESNPFGEFQRDGSF